MVQYREIEEVLRETPGTKEHEVSEFRAERISKYFPGTAQSSEQEAFSSAGSVPIGDKDSLRTAWVS